MQLSTMLCAWLLLLLNFTCQAELIIPEDLTALLSDAGQALLFAAKPRCA